MSRKFWGVPRGKRSLKASIEVLKAATPIMVGQVWNKDLQKKIDKCLVDNELKRERVKIDENPGNLRGNVTNLRVFGLIYEDMDKKIRLTQAGEELINPETLEVVQKNLLRKQVLNLQYPSPYFKRGNANIITDYSIRPYRFILSLLFDEELKYLTLEEMARFVVFTENDDQFDNVKRSILEYRSSDQEKILQAYFDKYKTRGIRTIYGDLIQEEVEAISSITGICDEEVKRVLLAELDIENTYRPNDRWVANYESRFDVVSTMKTHLTEAELISDTKTGMLILSEERKEEIRKILSHHDLFPKELISFEGYEELGSKGKKILELRFYNKYGQSWTGRMGLSRSDLQGVATSYEAIKERIIRGLYKELVKKEAFTNMHEAILHIKENSSFTKADISEVLKNQPAPNLGKFCSNFVTVGTDGSRNLEFEKMCRSVFKKLGFKVQHIGQKGRVPDVIAIYDGEKVGLIDAKATSNTYSVSSSDERAMRDYIRAFSKEYNVGFFVFVAGTTAQTADSNVKNIFNDTGVKGTIISSSVLASLLENSLCLEKSEADFEKLFQLNKEILDVDVENFYAENAHS